MIKNQNQTLVDQAITEGGGGAAPVGGGDFNLNEISVHSPSNDGVLFLDHPSVFVQLDIYEDLFSNVLKGTFSFLDTQGWAEMIPLIGDETIIISFATPGGEGSNFKRNQKNQILKLQVKKQYVKDLKYMIVWKWECKNVQKFINYFL